MGLIDTLKWLWDPTTEEQRQYRAWNAQTPLQRHIQHIRIYIKGIDVPFKVTLKFEDKELGDWLMRVDLDDDVRAWLSRRAKNGVTVDDVWYAPNMIERIELGEKTVESIE
jgi:hypothetical protein